MVDEGAVEVVSEVVVAEDPILTLREETGPAPTGVCAFIALHFMLWIYSLVGPDKS